MKYNQNTVDRALAMVQDSLKASEQPATYVSAPEDIERLARLAMGKDIASVEMFGLITLTTRHKLIENRIIFRGSIAQCNVYPREVLRHALLDNAGAVTLYHNHPSGDPAPGDADIRLTKELQDLLKRVDVRLLDHIVVPASDTRALSIAHLGHI